MNFLKNLDRLIYLRGITRNELAIATNTAPSTISAWYSRGVENISISKIKELSVYFGVSIDELIDGTDCNTIQFTDADYTAGELEIISTLARMLREQRIEKYNEKELKLISEFGELLIKNRPDK